MSILERKGVIRFLWAMDVGMKETREEGEDEVGLGS